MEQKKSKVKLWFLTTAKLLITMLLVILSSCLGVAFKDHIANAHIYYLISLISVIVLIVSSIWASFVFSRKVEQMKIQDIRDLTDKHINRMASNTNRESRKLQQACALSSVYIISLAFSALALCFFSGASGLGTGGTPVVSMYVVYGIVARFFTKKEKIDYSTALPKEQYPHLYRVAKEAAGGVNNVQIYIFLNPPISDLECNASVSQKGDEVYLNLGPTLLCTLNENELKQILLHEFAHIQHDHIKEFSRYTKLMDYLAGDDEDNSIFDTWTSLAMRFPIKYLSLKGMYYFTLSSHNKESDADEHAASTGDIIDQASALAKVSAYNLFIYEQEPYANVYRTGSIPKHYSTDRIHSFRKALVERESDWRRILENEIPALVASHPTFHQRWEALGNCTYSMKPAPIDGELAKECWAAAQEADRRSAEIQQKDYDQLRQVNYLDHLKTIQNYESENILLPPEEMRPIIYAYYSLGLPEKAEALCDRIITEYENPFSTAFARYWKGTLLLYRYDKSGLNYLYQAMETNSNYIDDGLDKIGHFCTMMGLQQELEEYRSRVVEFMQTAQDRSAGGINAKAKLSKETLPDDWQDKILSYILQISNNMISHVYLVHEQANEEYTPSSFILRYTDDATAEQRDEIYDKVFRLLDDWPTDWDFCLYDYEPSMEKPLSRVHDACIFDTNKS